MASYITVSALNNYLKRKFDADANLGHVYLKGEISNYKLHSRGHLYFSLKDETSVISAIMFETNARSLEFTPKEGTKVFVEGKVTVYEGSGKYQIVVTKMQPDGIGELYIAYEKLKAKLNEEGLFKPEHKKPIPKYPKKIGIVTAPTGAAIRDILSTIKRRYPIAETILFPALVQGDTAKTSIANQIEVANTYDLDVLIVGRGGGSIEDLWAFNEEIVARAIFASTIPIISAVGHEVDFTIADFVADLRAPTPTGAAELAVPNIADVYKEISSFTIRLSSAITNKIELAKKRLSALECSYALKNPLAIYEVKEQKLSNLIDKLEAYIKTCLANCQNRLQKVTSSYILKNPLAIYDRDRDKIKLLKTKLVSGMNSYMTLYNKNYELMVGKLDLLSPLGILKKGYSVVTKKDKVISSVGDLKRNDSVDIRLSDGLVQAKIENIKEK
ncbi:MAG TPA: exodeoxyribonuclease VII large subunit [Firmicutes bacterium]|nr:exodeoxyribonuclease VII large subunit [Bacillota bacterium]